MSDYYKTVDGRISRLLRGVPSFRPLPDEALAEIERMSIDQRDDLVFSADALIGLLQVHIEDLKDLKARALKRPALKIIQKESVEQ